MLLLMQILRCGTGRQKEALKRLHWIHSLMAARPDSDGAIVAKHLGNPIDLLILRKWQTQEAMMRRTNSYYQDQWPIFPPNEPEGIYQTQDIAHHFEEVMRNEGETEGGFIWRSTLSLPKEQWEEFLKYRTDEDAMMRESGGLVQSSTLRSVDNEELALTLVRLTDRHAMERICSNPERTRIAEHISKIATPVSYPDLDIFDSECFEVVDEFVR